MINFKNIFKVSSVIVALIITVATLFYSCTNFSYAKAVERKTDYCTATIEDNFADDRVIVIMDDSAYNFKSYTAADFPEAEIVVVDDLTQDIKDMLLRERAGEEENNLLNREQFKSIVCLTLKIASKQKVLDVVHALERRADILSAEPDYIFEIENMNSVTDTSSYSIYASDGGRAVSDLWRKTIQLNDAWKITEGSAEIKVGIIDSGIDKNHDGLKNSVNSEIGLNFTNINDNSTAYIDELGHGTQVAGIVGAKENGLNGICGINKEVELISLKTADKKQLGTDLVSSVAYAIATRIPVLNLSMLVYDYKTEVGDKDYKADLEAFERILYGYNGLLVVAAGNAGKEFSSFEYKFPISSDVHNMIVVGATDGSDNLWEKSNYGYGVDIYAPGTHIPTTALSDKCSTLCVKPDSELENDYDKEYKALHISSGYHYNSGTSFAAPMVTGVAALLLSLKSDLTGAQLKTLMLENADNITIKNKSAKRLNAFKAVAAMSESIFTTKVLNAYTVEITGFKDFVPTRLEIPAKIDGAAVVSIGLNAFFGCETLESLSFESGSWVQTIGIQAFASCRNLTSVEIPASVIKIDCAAFIACGNLNSLTFFNENPSLRQIESAAFGDCRSLSKVYLPKSLTKLGASAFFNCTELNKVVIQNSGSVAEIGENCFMNTANDLKLYVPRVLYYSYVSSFSAYADKFITI